MNNLQLINLIEQSWHESFTINMLCPTCDIITRISMSITARSIRLDCNKCKKKYFYRRINLGVIE